MSARLSLFAVLFAAAPVAGKDLDNKTVNRLTRPGATTIDVKGVAQFRVPQGYRWAAEGNLPDLAQAAELTVTGAEAGAILPDDLKWVALVLPVKDDPLAGTDPKNLNQEALRSWQERYSSGRRKFGGAASKVVGWTHPPVWDAEKKRLTMGVRLTADSGESGPDLVRYQLFVYGDGGTPVCLEAYTSHLEYQRPPADLPKLADEVKFVNPEAEAAAAAAVAEDPMWHYLKIGGGGLVGAVVVLALFWPRNRAGKGKVAARQPARRGPGLPR